MIKNLKLRSWFNVSCLLWLQNPSAIGQSIHAYHITLSLSRQTKQESPKEEQNLMCFWQILNQLTKKQMCIHWITYESLGLIIYTKLVKSFKCDIGDKCLTHYSRWFLLLQTLINFLWDVVLISPTKFRLFGIGCSSTTPFKVTYERTVLPSITQLIFG